MYHKASCVEVNGIMRAAMPLTTRLASLGQALRDLAYPPVCLGCGQRAGGAWSPLCTACRRRLEPADRAAIAAELSALPEPVVFASVRVCWVFDKGGPLQAVQHALKYGNRPRYGHLLGHDLARLWRGAPALPDLVVPLPLHRLRRLERGYNQSEALAEGMAAALGLVCRPDLLVRHRPTRSQTRLSTPQRWRNVARAFVAPCPTALAGRSVALVDDVITTGATLSAAAAALFDAGAAEVHATALGFARRTG